MVVSNVPDLIKSCVRGCKRDWRVLPSVTESPNFPSLANLPWRLTYLSDPGSNRHHWIIQAWSGVNRLFSLWCGMNGSAWPFPMPCKVLGRVQQLWQLQNFCSQLVLALCRDSERIRDPSAGVAAAVDNALSLTQAERRRREMQRPVKLCESKFWNLCPMKWFFSWSLDTEHGLFFSLYRLGPLQKCVHKQ